MAHNASVRTIGGDTVALLFPDALGNTGVAVFHPVIEIICGHGAQGFVIEVTEAKVLFDVFLEVVESLQF